MKHIDLFSGIGGFAYAVDQVWDNVEHVFCDNDPFAQQVLKKHWPESEVYNDIKNITNTPGKGLERPGRHKPKLTERAGHHRGVFILTGGFPCQPFSSAGVRRGTSDDRYLWPEMLRVIRLTAPEWIIAENVGGLVTWNEGMVLEQVCTDMEATGYEVQPFIIPAVSVNAPHRRDRIWFVAHSNVQRSLEGEFEIDTTERNEAQPGLTERNKATPSTRRMGRGSRGAERTHGKESQRSATTEEDKRFRSTEWDKNWMEVAAEFCSVDDGLPIELDGFKLSKAQHRAKQIGAYGNAIVPQVAIEIMKAIKNA